MKVIFAGPSLAGASVDLTGLVRRPPAAHGDLARAVLDGATSIGLIDGLFGLTAAVWHKEILFALDRGVRVLGAASMGALRAAECAPFGAEPIGIIAHRYLTGDLDDDAAVALCHLPGEAGWTPLTEPLVDVEATIVHLSRNRLIATGEAVLLWSAAKQCHFSERSVERMVSTTGLSADRADRLAKAYRAHKRSLKQIDALALVNAIRSAQATSPGRTPWQFCSSPMWERRLEAIQAHC